MNYYPILLDLADQPCVVVGGGEVATRKVEGLLSCGARVRVVAPEITRKLQALADTDRIAWAKHPYTSEDIRRARLVIGATDDEAVNRQIYADCRENGILCNIADRPECCEFILPSVIRRGDLVVAISTSGKSPAFAKALRKRLEKEFGPEFEVFLKLMGAVRKRLLAEAHEPEAHKHVFEKLIDRGLLDRIRDGDIERIDGVLAEVLGDGYRFEELLSQSVDEADQPSCAVR
ncbi:precorrin-2 dehydrogenase/sirohydrochlorin ferrochelatase family protein [Desulfatirhabdium butyrativorans]|uniref:precorrin-2 dehydrogenase/sirohydrochlorin ferrochelatase family protein n=1 Tax=Desulfatirhabdium butyrativorans TaxID=340467 RepID=UPI000427419F|nr:bifunctional precorrin-2 dehydrogenase/sirohydrochlorin ferrochelatase [Desulfatirhabdium butyrativorans]